MPIEPISRTEFDEFRAEVLDQLHALRAELARQRHEKSAREVRLERRHTMLRQLADAIGPINWGTAKEVRRVLLGEVSPPGGMERLVGELRRDAETPMSEGRIWGAISSEALTRLPSGGESGGVQGIINRLQRK